MEPDRAEGDYWLAQQRSIALARALIRQAKSALCPCGVLPRNCTEHDPARRTAPEEAQ